MTELLNVLVEVRRHPRHLRLRQRVDAEGLHKFVHPAGGNPGEVAVGEVGSGPQLRASNIDRADAGIKVAVTVTVALSNTVGVGFALLCTDDSVRVSGQRRVDHGLQQMPHQIRRRLGEGVGEQASRVDKMWSGHRVDAFRVNVGIPRRNTTVTAPTSIRRSQPPGDTTLWGTTRTGHGKRDCCD